LIINDFDYQRTIIAYHGCDVSVVDEVLGKEGKLKSSENRYDWLGAGIYFWEHGPQRAWEWANWRAETGSKRIKKPAVIGAILHLGTCFDLLDTANTDFLAELFPAFKKAQEDEGLELPINEAPKGGDAADLVLRYLDCAVVNWVLKELEKKGLHYDTVRCAFGEGGPAFPGSKILRQSHIQIAVRNPAVIVGYFLPTIDFEAKSTD
jgi:hypothetical protein